MKKAAFFIHDLNSWGGQDRSTMEIIKHLSQKHPIETYSFTFEKNQDSRWGNVESTVIPLKFKKPILIKYITYYLLTLPHLVRKRFKEKDTTLHSTGTASLISDVVQVQFLHAEWVREEKRISKVKSTKLSVFKRLYYHWLKLYKVFTEWLLYCKRKQYIAISENIKKQLREHWHIPPQNIHVIHHGVDANTFTPCTEATNGIQVRTQIRQQLQIPEDKLLFITVGAINERKGISSIIKSIPMLDLDIQDKVEFALIGQGPIQDFQKLASKYNVSSKLHFIPHSKSILDYYWAADAFLFPTFYEPFGLVILEAMACGLPTLASRCAGASELIKDQQNGILINSPYDSVEVSEKIADVVQNEELRKQLKENARQTAMQHSWDKVAQKYEQVLFSKTALP